MLLAFQADGARLEEATEALRTNGGKITDDMNDTQITHIIMDDDDSGRYAELRRRTAK